MNESEDTKKHDPSLRYQDWPVSKSDTRPVERGAVGGNPVFTLLRIVLWLLPAIIVPVIIILVLYLLSLFRVVAIGGFLCFAFCLAAVMIIGYFDQRVLAQQKQIEFVRIKEKAMGRIGIFVISQIFIIPVVWFTLLYGYCAVTDSGYF
jgi:hypothetical protein